MTNILFDETGYWTPAKPIEMDLETIRSVFLFNENRKLIFETYLDFLAILKEMGLENSKQWLDGSFVTRKWAPRDLDFVIFLDSTFFLKFEDDLRALRRTFTKLDYYFMPIYPKNHSRYNWFEGEEAYWYHTFLTIRHYPGRRKGFIELNF